MINAGKYKAQATEAHLDQSKKGTDYIAVALKLDVDGVPNELVWYGYLTEKTAPRTMKALRAMGWTGDNIETAESSNGSSLPTKVEAVVELDAYEGKVRPKVQWINSIGGGRSATLDKAALAKRLAAQAKATPTPGDDDDGGIPF